MPILDAILGSNIDTFLELDGIDGESEVPDFEGKINIMGWEWGANWPLAQGGTLTRGRLRIHHLVVKKYIDKSSTPMLQHMHNNTPIQTAKITNRKVTGGLPLKFLVITLSNARILGMTRSAAQGEKYPMETITLGFERYSETYEGQDSDGESTGLFSHEISLGPEGVE